jgi:hypothetical protein
VKQLQAGEHGESYVAGRSAEVSFAQIGNVIRVNEETCWMRDLLYQ